MNWLIKVAGAGLALLGAAGSIAQTPNRKSELTGRIEAFLSALEGNNRKAFDKVTTPDFRAFENGRIYDRQAFFDLVQGAMKDGMRPDFTITDTRVSAGDTVASVNYLNHGSYATPGGMQAISWLEVVSLRRDNEEWRIDFLESQVQTPPRR